MDARDVAGIAADLGLSDVDALCLFTWLAMSSELFPADYISALNDRDFRRQAHINPRYQAKTHFRIVCELKDYCRELWIAIESNLSNNLVY